MPLIIFLIYIFFETLFSYETIEFIGVFGFFLEIILTALIGFTILVNFRTFFNEALKKIYSREITHQAFIESNIFRILGAFLLILPGILSDCLGIIMQFSSINFMFIRPFLKPSNLHRREKEIIDVEVIEKTKESNHL
ncbi:MAG: FxsA family protein [Helicobacter sp.]|nr:FxsA family protein [Helicobacter sp.]